MTQKIVEDRKNGHASALAVVRMWIGRKAILCLRILGSFIII